jgi:hypothetical protein
MTRTAKTLLGLGILLAIVVWAMLARPLSSSTIGAATGRSATTQETADNSATATTAGQFSSEIKAFDKSADSIDFNSDFSTGDIDAAMNAQ